MREEIKSVIDRFKKNEEERVKLNSEIYPIFTELSKNHNKVEFFNLSNELPISGIYNIWTLYNNDNDKDEDFFDREELFDYY